MKAESITQLNILVINYTHKSSQLFKISESKLSLNRTVKLPDVPNWILRLNLRTNSEQFLWDTFAPT